VQVILAAVKLLEESGGGVREPTKSPAINGRWRLLYTTRPDSASPIQRTFTGVDRFGVIQVRNWNWGQAQPESLKTPTFFLGSGNPLLLDMTAMLTFICAFEPPQEIDLVSAEGARCNNIVSFGEDVGELKVEVRTNR
jgi:hypothetical protein